MDTYEHSLRWWVFFFPQKIINVVQAFKYYMQYINMDHQTDSMLLFNFFNVIVRFKIKTFDYKAEMSYTCH